MWVGRSDCPPHPRPHLPPLFSSSVVNSSFSFTSSSVCFSFPPPFLHLSFPHFLPSSLHPFFHLPFLSSVLPSFFLYQPTPLLPFWPPLCLHFDFSFLLVEGTGRWWVLLVFSLRLFPASQPPPAPRFWRWLSSQSSSLVRLLKGNNAQAR